MDVEDVLNLQVFDLIIMSDITWYVLDSLPRFAAALYRTQKGATLVHSLVTYPPGEQKHGKDFFTNGSEIRAWWKGINWFEWLDAGDTYHSTINTLNIGTVKNRESKENSI